MVPTQEGRHQLVVSIDGIDDKESHLNTNFPRYFLTTMPGADFEQLLADKSPEPEAEVEPQPEVV